MSPEERPAQRRATSLLKSKQSDNLFGIDLEAAE